MIAPIDDRIRTFHKGLFTSDHFGYEDPTYLGFSLHFDFDPVFRNVNTGQTDDALFAEPGQDLESAQGYLTSIGFPQRANMLKEFKEIMRYMNENAPYFFQGVTGVSDLWKIEKESMGFEPFRGHGKKLVFDCLESIDLRMTALADLYRQASFDGRFMRYLLPENLRWFTLTIRIAEIRKFHKIKAAVSNVSSTDVSDPRAIPPPDSNPDVLKVVDDLISVVEFKLSHCQFNFEDSFGDEFLMNGETEMATQKFAIEVGTIYQKSTYKLLDLLLTDYFSTNANNINEGSIVIGGKFGGKSNPTTRPVLDDVPIGSRIPGYDQSINPSNLFGGAISSLKQRTAAFGNEITGLGGRLVGEEIGKLQSKITAGTMGNVYGIETLRESINSFLGEGDQIPIEQIQPGEDVYPGVPGKDTTTKTVKTLGNVYTLIERPKPSAKEEIRGPNRWHDNED